MPGGPKLLAFDPATGKLIRGYALIDRVLFPRSFIDDVRFNGDKAYAGRADVKLPVQIFQMQIGAKPSPLDHP